MFLYQCFTSSLVSNDVTWYKEADEDKDLCIVAAHLILRAKNFFFLFRYYILHRYYYTLEHYTDVQSAETGNKFMYGSVGRLWRKLRMISDIFLDHQVSVMLVLLHNGILKCLFSSLKNETPNLKSNTIIFILGNLFLKKSFIR